jgi:hypothetical protein
MDRRPTSAGGELVVDLQSPHAYRKAIVTVDPGYSLMVID